MSEPTRAERLQAVQDVARRMRCEAFVDYSPVVAGEVLRPITLRTHNALLAMRNGFVTGTAGVGLVDVINFIWLHHPNFGQFNRAEKQRVSRRVVAALTPAFPAINDVARVAMTFPGFAWLRCVARPAADELQGAAITEIFRLLAEARGDFPSGDETGEPTPFANQAHMLNLFRRELGMSFEETLGLPMKQAIQHYREIVHHTTRGKALMLTPAEAEIWREHLKQPEPTPANAAVEPDTDR